MGPGVVATHFSLVLSAVDSRGPAEARVDAELVLSDSRSDLEERVWGDGNGVGSCVALSRGNLGCELNMYIPSIQ